MNVTLRQLQVFAAIAQQGSFAESARSLHLTGAALSQIVRSFEETVGFKVFDRTTRSLKLTQAGLALLPKATQLLAEHRNLIRSIHDIQTSGEGTVRIAVTQPLSCTVLPKALTKFTKERPGISVVQVDAQFESLQDLLLRGEVDFGLGAERICHPDLEALHMFSTPLFLSCSTHHRFAKRPEVCWAELKGETIVLADRHAAPLMARDAQYQLTFEGAIDVGHFTTALAMANENRGVVITSWYARELVAAYDLALLPLVEPATLRKIMLYRNRRLTQSPAAVQLAQWLPSLLADAEHGLIAK